MLIVIYCFILFLIYLLSLSGDIIRQGRVPASQLQFTEQEPSSLTKHKQSQYLRQTIRSQGGMTFSGKINGDVIVN
jgi:hypothetical protein